MYPPENKSFGTLMLGFAASRRVKNKCSLSQPVYGIFVLAAGID